MSDIKTPRPIAAGMTGASDLSTIGRQGDVLTLGVDIGLVALLEVPTAPAPKDAPVPGADRYETRPESTPRERRDDTVRKETPNDPFDSLTRQAAVQQSRKLCERPRDLNDELELSTATLGQLAALQTKTTPRDPSLLGKLQLGAMLLANDAQGAKKQPLDEAALGRLASRIAQGQSVTKQEAEAFWLRQARFVASSRASIQDYVQRVLRESYLIQSTVLLDYGERVRALNERKRQLRELVTTARDTRAAWLAEKGTSASESWVAARPLDYVDVDENNALFTVQMTSQDVAAERAIQERSSSSEGASVGQDWLALSGESRLTAQQIDLLKEMDYEKGRFGTGTDDYIRDHLSELVSALPNMNGTDLDKYLVPILEHLTSGNADEDALMEIFRALSPMQLLFAAGNQFPYGGLNDQESADLRLLVRESARQAAAFAGDAQLASNGLLTPAAVTKILEAVKAAVEQQHAETPAPIESGDNGVGAPKRIRTLEQIDAYIKHLEEQMNGAGDDSQLANADLQNALQKQQQTLQMMSNISKMLHDTALAIVRKTGQ